MTASVETAITVLLKAQYGDSFGRTCFCHPSAHEKVRQLLVKQPFSCVSRPIMTTVSARKAIFGQKWIVGRLSASDSYERKAFQAPAASTTSANVPSEMQFSLRR